MSRLKKSKKSYSFGMGLSFIPLIFTTGLINDRPRLGLVLGILFAALIECLRWNRLTNAK